jgi:hypothetical protein
VCDVLSPRLNLHNVEKEARDLLHGLKRRDPTALRRYYSFDPLADMSEPGLDDARYVVAVERGYGSWQKLKEHLHTTSSSGNC